MTTLQTVIVNLGPRDRGVDAITPTTPRGTFDIVPRQHPREEPAASTPTRPTFAEANGKRALPTSPVGSSFPAMPEPVAQAAAAPSPHREDLHRSAGSAGSQDVEMQASDEGEDASDAESMDDETGRPSKKKKKKGQRFFCTDYPPCNLSFTRSEHLARHIRKHTGERPFQCHCARRFSRLDNLRQHAQTVHVNEDIPGDSLAATGTRFQRQVRTDRVRPQGARSRASTAGSQAPHARGHGRNLSTSSIASSASTASTLSTVSTVSRDDTRIRLQPLLMAHEQPPHPRLTVDTVAGSPQYACPNPSSGGPSTPTSTTYSAGPASPYGSSIGSPMSTATRYAVPWSDRTPNRRLSVPNGQNPFQTAQGGIHGPPYLSPFGPSNVTYASKGGNFPPASPTGSAYSFSRQDQTAAEIEWRRRTWHPSTYSAYGYQRPATSGLSYSQTPDAPRPAFSPQAVAAAGQPQRLPGFETFDQISQRPVTPPRQTTSSGQADAATGGPPLFSGRSSDRSISGPSDKSWDMSLHQNLTKLDIANGLPQKDAGVWSRQVIAEMQSAAAAASLDASFASQNPQGPTPLSSQESCKQPTEPGRYRQPRRTDSDGNRRRGWYDGPLATSHQASIVQRTSPADSSGSEDVHTPSNITIEYHPSIVHPNGFIEATRPGATTTSGYSDFGATTSRPNSFAGGTDSSRSKNPDLSGLEALVAAAATNENKARAAAG